MKISFIKLAYFSPTKTTQKILDAIAQGVGVTDVDHINLTSPDARTKTYAELNDELVLLGAPVYAGRLPKEAVKRISRLKGNNTPAVVVVLYGNREYDDALLELRDLAVTLGFVPVSAGAFIGEHSYTSPEFPIADGRPDAQDIQKAVEFGKAVLQKMESIENLKNETPIAVSGNCPYKDGRPSSDECAETMEEDCKTCGTCVDLCPMAAITLNEHVETNPERCILCCACVKGCPNNARVIESPRIKQVAKWLHENYSIRKQPQIFL